MDQSEFDPAEEAASTQRLPPRDRFASNVLQFDLTATAAKLEQESSKGQSGHRQIALYKHEKSTIALFRFEKGGSMPAHKAKGTVFVQVIEGKLTLMVEGVEHVLEAGGMLVLAPGVEHDVNAHETTVMLLTVCLDH